MHESATLIYQGKKIELPIVEGCKGHRAINISNIANNTGLLTFDPDYSNTSNSFTTISYSDSITGELSYRGIPVEQLAEYSSFGETAFLLVHKRLPLQHELDKYSQLLTRSAMIHEDMISFLENFPQGSNSMATLAAMVSALRTFYPRLEDPEEEIDHEVTTLLAKVRTLAAHSYKKTIGEKVVYPRHDLKYCENFLYMMFNNPVNGFFPDAKIEKALNVYWILHAELSSQCSTGIIRMLSSGNRNLYASISAAITDIWVSMHESPDQHVYRLLNDILDYKKVKDIIQDAKNNNTIIPGFDSEYFKCYDPRAKILKKTCEELVAYLGKETMLLEAAQELEYEILADQYFADRGQFPSNHLYGSILLTLIGIPYSMFPVMRTIGKLAGWIAHWLEELEIKNLQINKPQQLYAGPEDVINYIPIGER